MTIQSISAIHSSTLGELRGCFASEVGWLAVFTVAAGVKEWKIEIKYENGIVDRNDALD
jgi:hypothetical protein